MTLVHRRFAWLALLPFLALTLVLAGCEDVDEDEVVSAIELEVTEVEDDGFANPIGVVHDDVDDVYLVSNMNGDPTHATENAFISRVSPDGEVLEANWIDLTGTPRALNSPRGMAIRDDSLFVADIDCIRIYDRPSGADDGFTCLDNVTYIADVDIGPEGSIFAIDAGMVYEDGEWSSTGTDAVYRIVTAEGRQGSTLASGEELGNPGSLAVGSRGIFVTTMGTGELYAVSPDGSRTSILPQSDQRLGGIVFLADGSFVFSSLTDSSLTMIDAGGQVIDLAEGIPDAQILGYDAQRNRLIVPIPSENRILFLDLPDMI